MLKVENLHKSFKKKEVLRGISFNVKPGEIKALIGVNGAGKSTLIECICGVKDFEMGEILVDGISIADKKRKKLIKQSLGYMTQSFSLFNDLTVEENLGYLCAVYDIDKSNVKRVVELCELTSHRKHLAKNLSGGYKQLLSMASAIIHSPKFLILDEPTASMDPIFRKRFWWIVNKCKEQGITALVITHYMEELAECDSFICLSNGKVAFDGTLKDYKKKGPISIENILKDLVVKD
jgi:ABC-2 type transport system ATP-binding protein